ncbi:MAG: WD domain-containing protein, G-beta repeat-containing protein [Glomeribacter sp. 1016415]|nr:WD domain-containing protein, G-beta repeat-containing protein [Glomeribacter sp. 1016415]
MTGVQFGEWPYLEVESDVNSYAYSPDGKSCAMGLENGVIRVYDASSWTTIRTLTGHTSNVYSVVYSPSGLQLASGSRDQTVRVWEVISGDCLTVIQDFNGSVHSVAWKETPEGPYLVTSSKDKSVRQWEVKKDGADYKVKLSWSKGAQPLIARGMLIEGATGLSEINEKLLKQRRAEASRESLAEREIQEERQEVHQILANMIKAAKYMG